MPEEGHTALGRTGICSRAKHEGSRTKSASRADDPPRKLMQIYRILKQPNGDKKACRINEIRQAEF
jgi:hypothetical protein